MKVYKFYLVRSYAERMEMGIQFGFELSYLYDKMNDSCLILYAWTTDKNIRDEFKETRSKEFILSSSEIFDNDKFHKFSVDFKMEKLDYFHLKTYNEKKKKFVNKNILMTFNEHVCIAEYPSETFGSLMEPLCDSPYCIYKQKYIEALDVFLYTLFHNIYYGEDESIEDLTSYLSSYGLTPKGNSLSSLIKSIDQLKLFTVVFSSLFK